MYGVNDDVFHVSITSVSGLILLLPQSGQGPECGVSCGSTGS